MSLRALTWTVVMIAAGALMGCDEKDSGASKDAAASTTAASDTSAATMGESTTTVPVDFDEEIAKLDAALEQAEGDLCALVKVFGRPLAVVPTTPEQAKVVLDRIVEMIDEMGDVAEPGDGKYYEAAAERLRDEAEEHDYSPEWLTGSEPFSALDDPEFFEASGRLQARYQEQCGEKTTPTG